MLKPYHVVISSKRLAWMKHVKTVYFNCPIKSSEIERFIAFDWRFFCEFDFVQLCSAIELNQSIKFDCVYCANPNTVNNLI